MDGISVSGLIHKHQENATVPPCQGGRPYLSIPLYIRCVWLLFIAFHNYLLIVY